MPGFWEPILATRANAELLLSGDEEESDSGHSAWAYTGYTLTERGHSQTHLMEQSHCALEWRDLNRVTPGAQTKFPKNGRPFRIELEFKYEIPNPVDGPTHAPLHHIQYGDRISEEERVLLSFGGYHSALTVVVGNRYAAPQLLIESALKRFSVLNSNKVPPSLFAGLPKGVTQRDKRDSKAGHLGSTVCKLGDETGCHTSGMCRNGSVATYETCYDALKGQGDTYDNGRWHTLLLEWDGQSLSFGTDGNVRTQQ
jgi:hypothetical protein